MFDILKEFGLLIPLISLIFVILYYIFIVSIVGFDTLAESPFKANNIKPLLITYIILFTFGMYSMNKSNLEFCVNEKFYAVYFVVYIILFFFTEHIKNIIKFKAEEYIPNTILRYFLIFTGLFTMFMFGRMSFYSANLIYKELLLKINSAGLLVFNEDIILHIYIFIFNFIFAILITGYFTNLSILFSLIKYSIYTTEKELIKSCYILKNDDKKIIIKVQNKLPRTLDHSKIYSIEAEEQMDIKEQLVAFKKKLAHIKNKMCNHSKKNNIK